MAGIGSESLVTKVAARREASVQTRGVDDVLMAQRIRLLGSWSDHDLFSGSMESEELVFEGDGTGWHALENLAGSDKDHFAWEVVGPGRLVVQTTQRTFEPLGDHPDDDGPGSPRWPEPIEVLFSFERGRAVFSDSDDLDVLRVALGLFNDGRFARRAP